MDSAANQTQQLQINSNSCYNGFVRIDLIRQEILNFEKGRLIHKSRLYHTVQIDLDFLIRL